ncbi:hypothetical protein BT96DRAFT_992028 [Gymnopus androsaceus JB14]|uniref:F-box domain-containing protein n=1 Tax=Gymnopus androsaceus JB14 TaxID=1447944 RepID=A0A6A4HXA8_9AGAR|nr:hypothetical protein BT96DRAFT_992028 [Gymnopus androsaceus JB14]
MVHPLPTNLSISFLENLCSDKATLRNCALVGRAWAPAAQRGIFQHITLESPRWKVGEGLSRVATYLEANCRLIASLDENPRLVSYIQSLELRDFAVWKEDIAYVSIHNSTAEIVLRLSNVEKLSFQHMMWNNLSPRHKAALANMLKAASITRILVSLLSHAVHLKVLKLGRVALGDSAFENFILPESDHRVVLPRSIKLSQLTISFTPDLTDWFQHESCLFEVRHLHSLHIQTERPYPFAQAAAMLRYVGANLRELHLQSPHSLPALEAASNLFHLGYTPNLHVLRLHEVIQMDTVTSIPWVKSLFEPLLNSDQSRCTPKQLIIELYLHNPLRNSQWAHWVELDALLEKPQFSSLETVNIILVGRDSLADGVVERLNRELLFLKRSGKLNMFLAS